MNESGGRFRIAMDRALRLRRSPWLPGAVITVLVLLATLGVRELGILQPLEIALYDRYTELRSDSRADDSGIVIIGIAESDLQRLQRDPVDDATIATALEQLASYGPRAIGLDVYRDLPLPPGTEELHTVLRENPNIVAIRSFGTGPDGGVSCPGLLAGTDRCAFSDLKHDADGVVRRGLLLLSSPGRPPVRSFALQMALTCCAVQEAPGDPDPHDLRLVSDAGGATIPRFRANDGGYVRADDRGYQFLIDFDRSLDRFPTFTLSELLGGEVGGAVIRDKVVFVGYTAQSKSDLFHVPANTGGEGDPVPGVVHHAHVLSQLLRLASGESQPIRVWSNAVEGGWILLWTGLGVTLGLLVRRTVLFVLLAAAGLAAIGIAGYLLFAAKWWVPTASPMLAGFGGASLALMSSLARERGLRARLEQSLGPFIPRPILERILDDPGDFLDDVGRIRPRHMIATVLFADLKGYTSAAEEMAPDRLMSWINEFMEEMATAIGRHGGVVDDYFGDGIKGDFGPPDPGDSEDRITYNAIGAVNCALEMERAIVNLNTKWRQDGGQTIGGLRIGIYSGPGVAGSIGPRDRLKYTLVGDVVNTAARLESFDQVPHDFEASPVRILVGETTWERVREQFKAEELGTFLVKGKRKEVTVHRIIARLGPVTREDPS